MQTMPHIPVPAAALAECCKRRNIHRLWFFGSVLRDDFRPDSDVDILVKFDDDARLSALDFVDIQDELSALLGRRVDLVEEDAVTNPFRRKEIFSTRQEIYAA